MSEKTLEQEATFFPVALAMLEPGKVLPCEIWIRHEGKRPVLYRTANLPFTEEHRQRLLDAGVEHVYISFEEADAWNRYLEDQLRDRISDPTKPLEERAKILLDTAEPLMREVLENPAAPGVKERVGNLAGAIVELIDGPEAFATAIQLMGHDYYTYTHCTHVSIYLVALARETGIDAPDVLQSLGRAGLMHDCGKCRIPRELINKPGKFTPEEWEQMKRHPAEGIRILEEAGWRDEVVREVCLRHHERLDGTGYPDGVTDRELDRFTRMAAIVDAFDAMTTDRSYQKGMTGFEALRIIHVKGKGKYDPELVQRFVVLVARR